MSITADEVKLINRALTRIGAASIFAPDEETELAAATQAIWTDVKEQCLALHRWSFARQVYRLNRRPETPENGWKYAFDIPGTVLGGPEKVLRDPRRAYELLRDFDVQGVRIYADVDELYALFPVVPDVALWPPLFRSAVVLAAAAALAVPVAHDERLAASLREQAGGGPREGGVGGLIGRAIAMDIASRPIGSPFLASDPLTDARYA